MSKILHAIGRKTLGLALIFNSLLSLSSAANILTSFYMNMFQWQPYSPYLVDGSLFWFVILMAGLNIFSAKFAGKTNMKRILFHHYVYGLLVSSTAFLLVALFAPTYIMILIAPSAGFQTDGFQNIPIYAGLFFVYGGLTLVIDDAYDVSLKMGRVFDKVKMRIRRLGNVIQTIHLCSILASIYVTTCILLWYLENLFWIVSWPLLDISHIVFISNLFITCVWGLKSFEEKLWFKVFSDLPKKGSRSMKNKCSDPQPA